MHSALFYALLVSFMTLGNSSCPAGKILTPSYTSNFCVTSSCPANPTSYSISETNQLYCFYEGDDPYLGDCFCCRGEKVLLQGWRNQGENQNSFFCVLCEAGKYRDTIVASLNCLSCPAGKYSATMGATSANTCTSCTGNTIAPNAGQSSCSQCSAGYVANTEKKICVPECPIGNYWNTAQLRCDPCEYGKYKDTVGSTLCTSCNPGYSSSNGASTCMLCTIANAQVASTGGWAGYCTCNKGYYGTIINPGCDIELGCSLYHNAYGGGACTACAAGKYYWQPFTYGNTDSNQCADCPASHPYSAPGSITCTTTAPVPTTCPTGQYLPSTSSSACELCTAGTYKASTGTAACQDCAAFSTSPAGSSAVTQCTCNAVDQLRFTRVIAHTH
jgi:hypothetical protein